VLPARKRAVRFAILPATALRLRARETPPYQA